jgi:hypothetical protein
MKKIFIAIAFVLSFSAKAQIRLVHINAEFNARNDWEYITNIKNVKLLGGYIDKVPSLQKAYNIKYVPTLIIFNGSEEVKRWEAGLDMKLHIKAEEVQEFINKL